MDALLICPPAALGIALTSAFMRREQTVLTATHADTTDPERSAWLLDETRRPALVIVFEQAPYATARLLLDSGRTVLVVEERQLTVRFPSRQPERSAAGRALARAARARGGSAHVLRLGRTGARWVAPGDSGPALSAAGTAALIMSQLPPVRASATAA